MTQENRLQIFEDFVIKVESSLLMNMYKKLKKAKDNDLKQFAIADAISQEKKRQDEKDKFDEEEVIISRIVKK